MESGRNGGGAEALPWAHLRLPPFPQVALRVLKLVQQENIGLQQLCELISADTAFASEVLTVANSALYSPRYPSSSILQALTVLGARTLQGMCVTVGVRAYLGKAMAQPAMSRLWRHNLACAMIAELLAEMAGEEKNICYTAGILHDLGRVALAVLQPKSYGSVLEEYQGSVDGILESERALFGIDHCETGRQLVTDWNLPEILASAVSEHHEPICRHEVWDIGDLIRISCRLADAAGFPAFSGCEALLYEDILKVLPDEARHFLSPDIKMLAAQIEESIHAIEQV